MAEVDPKRMKLGVGLGVLGVFAIVYMIALLGGVDGTTALLMAAFIAFFVGGGLGLLIGISVGGDQAGSPE